MRSITSVIWQNKELTPHEKFVLLAIADEPFCTIKVICDKTGLSERWVRNCIKQLTQLCLIHMQKKDHTHTYAHTSYLNKGTNELSAGFSALRSDQESHAQRTHARVVDNNIHSTSGSGKVLYTNFCNSNVLIFKSTSVCSSNTRVNPIAMKSPPMQQRINQDDEKYKRLTPHEREKNLYRLLFSFKRHVSPHLCITLVEDRRSPYRENGGRLTHELEELWRKTLYKYRADYQVKYDELLRRVEKLGRYIGQRKPFQLHNRKMSFLEFLTSKHRYFEKWMAIALTDPTCEIPIETIPIQTKKEARNPTQEEQEAAREAFSVLNKKFNVSLQIA